VLCCLLNPLKSQSTSLRVYSIESPDIQYSIYTNGQTEDAWNSANIKAETCQGPDMAIESVKTTNRSFTIKNEGTTARKINSINVAITKNFIVPSVTSIVPVTLEPNEQLNFTISYKCDNQLILDDDLNGWDYVYVTIATDSDTISFNYLKICTLENRQGFDSSLYITLAIAVLVVAWASRVKETIFKDEAENMDEIKPIHALFFVIFASAILLIIFYFSKYLKTIFNIFFAFSAVSSLTLLFSQWAEPHIPKNSSLLKRYTLPVIGKFKYFQAVCFGLALTIVIVWFISHNWILNNVIGLSIVCLIFKVIKLPSLKVGTILLSALFFYDIFWVFFSEPIFGKSVMITAATSIDIPNKIVIPYFGDTPYPRCSLLGLGDMVLPGFFVTFNYRWGLFKRTSIYYRSSVLAYAIGVALCGLFLVIFRTGQPALLYIVPSVIGMSVFISWSRGELAEMWKGLPHDNYYSNMANEKHNIQLSSDEMKSEV